MPATIVADAPELAQQCRKAWAASQRGLIKSSVFEDSNCRALGPGTFAHVAREMNASYMTIGGVHVPKFNFTFIRRFGDVYFYRRPLEPTDSPEYRLPSHVELVQRHDLADVIVLNFGLHAGNASHYRMLMTHALRDLERFGRQPGKVAVYRETSSQHFPAPSGDYHEAIRRNPLVVQAKPPASAKAAGHAKAAGRAKSLGRKEVQEPTWAGPSMCRQIEKEAPQHWRNAVLSQLLSDRPHPHVHFQPFEALTRPRWDFHSVAKWANGGWKSDCTHWCWSPCFWELSFHDLFQVLSASTSQSSARALDQRQPSSFLTIP